MRNLFLVFILILVNGFNLLFIEHCYADSKKDDYELQEKCANKSMEWFKGEFGNGFKSEKDGQWLYNYQNHYNKKFNKCFVVLHMTHLPKGNDKTGTYMKDLIDVNENKGYGSYFGSIGAMKPGQCEVQGKYCSSEGEWDLLVKPYMEQ